VPTRNNTSHLAQSFKTLYNQCVTETKVLNDAQQLLENLEQLPEPVVRPVFIVVSGLPGTGKSYFCRRLAERTPLIILESDAMRKALFPSPVYSTEEDHSEADWEVFQKMKTSVQKIGRNHFAVDTSRDIAPVLDKIVREVNR
jgi:hypothetical protein